MRKAHSALKDIRDPEAIMQTSKNTLQYIRNKYAIIYQKEDIDIDSAIKITEDLPQITSTHNSILTKEISQEEISNIIKKLLNNKAPSTDSLIYEFYKLTEKVINPVLYRVFNHALTTGIMPSS